MNSIFICVFSQEKYVEMFLLLLESIFTYGNIGENIHLLIYTSTPFMNMIKNTDLYFFNEEKIVFEINDNYHTINSACKARLDLFEFSSVRNYEKILYLDTDIIVKGDIRKVFDVCKKDVLYALEEGSIECDTDFWGKTLFGDEIHNYTNKYCFTSGILLFNNCEKIRGLFSQIKEDVIRRPYNFATHDQPYIIYNAFKNNLYDNQVMKSYVVNNSMDIHSDKVIHHFPGGPGNYHHKIYSMSTFLNNMKMTI